LPQGVTAARRRQQTTGLAWRAAARWATHPSPPRRHRPAPCRHPLSWWRWRVGRAALTARAAQRLQSLSVPCRHRTDGRCSQPVVPASKRMCRWSPSPRRPRPHLLRRRPRRLAPVCARPMPPQLARCDHKAHHDPTLGSLAECDTAPVSERVDVGTQCHSCLLLPLRFHNLRRRLWVDAVPPGRPCVRAAGGRWCVPTSHSLPLPLARASASYCSAQS